MNTWILIVFLHWGQGAGATSAVFKSKESCLQAAQFINANGNWNKLQEAMCFEDKK